MDIFTSAKCTPVTYALAFLSVFGLEALLWDPLVVRDSFLDHFKVKLTLRAFNKLQAGLTMIGTDAFLSTILGFLMCTAACSNKPISLGLIPYVSLKDICWAFYLYQLLLGLKVLDVDADIDLYVQLLLKLLGITKLPDFLSFIELDLKALLRAQTLLASDAMLFSAYNIRQQNTVLLLLLYVNILKAEQIAQLLAIEASPKIVKIRYKNT